jgi:hypothetical protein
MAKKMGFDELPVKFKYGNQPVTVMIDGVKVKFKSRLEYRWAQYLEFLKEAGQIKDWYYEHHTFFFDNAYKLTQWTPDFLVRNNDNEFEYYETKGMLSGFDIKKCRALFEQRPKVKLTMVFWTPPKISVQKITQLERYCHRIIWNGKEVVKNVPMDMN